MSDDPAPPASPIETPAPISEHDPVPAIAPVAGRERIRAMDTLRGVSVLGILLVNILTFGLPAPGIANPALAGRDLTTPDLVSWFATYVLFDGKFRAIFSMLFGAGTLLFIDRACRRGAGIQAADLYYRRTLWLMFFGVVHAYLIWWGDVLFWFGVFGLVLFPFRNRSPAFLLTAGGLLLAVQIPMAVVEHVELTSLRDRGRKLAAASAAGKTLTEEEQTAWWAWEQKKRELDPPAKDLVREVEAQRAGWWKIFLRRVELAARMQSAGVYQHGLTDVCSMMLIGMGLMKLGVFSAGLSGRSYRWLASAGYGIGLPLNTYDSVHAVLEGFNVLEYGLFHQCSYPVGRLAVALGHIAVVMLVCRAGWLWWLTGPLAAVGQMALTNYLLQSVICTALFDGWGFGWFATLQRYELLYVVLAVWAFQIVTSRVWLRIFRFGPAEWTWRVLTYWLWQPILSRSNTSTEAGGGYALPQGSNNSPGG
jgi:uncharacterized protein